MFILSKGLNAGKPLAQPCPNCFAVEFSSADDAFRFRALCLILMQSHIFSQYLKGSVIPFLTIRDFRSIISRYFVLVDNLPAQFGHLVEVLANIEEQEQKNRSILNLLSQYRMALIADFTRQI
ncbi:MAG: hypothetical protein QMB99_10005 [Paludibacteraceae bacterium]